MKDTHRKSLMSFAFTLSLGLCLAGRAGAQDGHEHKHGAPHHGGKVAMTEEYHFEVVFAKDGLTVYPRTHEDKPIDASRLTGTATFYHPNSPKPWFERKLAATVVTTGHAPSSIGLAIDLSKVPATGAKVQFRVEGLPDEAEPTAEFTVPFTLVKVTLAKATEADQAAVQKLKLCPVSGEDLNSMGGPLKVSLGDKSTFICCKGCLKKIETDPGKYLTASGASSKGDTKHDHEH